MADTQDVDVLKRRGRRRLVGAIALVLLAVIVLPMVFDQQPKRSPAPISVRIPAQDEAGSLLKPPPAAPEAAKPAPPVTEPASPPQAAPAPALPPKAAPAPAPKSASPPAAAKTATKAKAKAKAKAETKTAEAEHARAVAALEDKQFVVPVAALAERSSVRRLTARLKAAKLPYFTAPIATAKGEVTRVRAGPFASREAADKAYAKLRRMGLKPGKVIPKS